jgi:hypothetical protein
VERYLTLSLGILFGVLLLGSLGTFLLFVPVFPFVVVATILLSLILMFLLGVQAGGRRIRISRMTKAWRSQVERWNSSSRVG